MSEEDLPEPSFRRTYRRADGEPIHDHAWVTDLAFFEFDLWEPLELIEEEWVRRRVRRRWVAPTTLYACEECEEDAVAWDRDAEGVWHEVCAEHRLRLTPPEHDPTTPPYLF